MFRPDPEAESERAMFFKIYFLFLRLPPIPHTCARVLFLPHPFNPIAVIWASEGRIVCADDETARVARARVPSGRGFSRANTTLQLEREREREGGGGNAT